jgi:SAM-dependent methyltransferase
MELAHEEGAVAAPSAARAQQAGPSIGVNLGCGPMARPGWINCDSKDLPGVDLRSDLSRLALGANYVDYIAAIHVLQDLAYEEIVPALREIRRVLKPGGVLRLAVPDIDRAINAYVHSDAAYFYVPDEHARTIGGKLVTQIIWYGSVRTPCNFDFISESLAAAGYHDICRCAFGETCSRFPQLASLDNRERETLFVEALK